MLQTERVSRAGTDRGAGSRGRTLHYSAQYRPGGALPGEIKTPPQARDGETATQRRPGSSPGEWKVHHIALSRDGRWLALTPEKGAILLYDLHQRRSGRPLSRRWDPGRRAPVKWMQTGRHPRRIFE